MRLTTRTPNWIIIRFAARKINDNWDQNTLIDYLIENDYTTRDKILDQIDIENILQRRPNWALTDYLPDLWEVSDIFIEHIIDDLRRDEAEIFYYEQWLYLEEERLKEEEEKKKQEPE